LKFEEVAMHHYSGWDYFLPVFNGKSMRIKKKMFKVFAIPKETVDGTVFYIKKMEKIK
jgi:hypothetical protein